MKKRKRPEEQKNTTKIKNKKAFVFINAWWRPFYHRRETNFNWQQIFTFCVSGSINQFQAPVAVHTDTTIRITLKQQKTNTQFPIIWCFHFVILSFWWKTGKVC